MGVEVGHTNVTGKQQWQCSASAKKCDERRIFLQSPLATLWDIAS